MLSVSRMYTYTRIDRIHVKHLSIVLVGTERGLIFLVHRLLLFCKNYIGIPDGSFETFKIFSCLLRGFEFR